MHMAQCTIFGGCDACGKTSLIGVLKSVQNKLGMQLCTTQSEKLSFCVENRLSFYIESNLFDVQLVPALHRARKAGYSVFLYYISLSDADEALQRIANRVAKGGHDIPEEDVRRRYEER